MIPRLCILGGVLACTEPVDELRCTSMSNAAASLDVGVETITVDDDPTTFPTGPGEVLRTEEAWATAVKGFGTDAGLSLDFDSQMVFVMRWLSDSCDTTFDYAAWQEDDRVRVVFEETVAGSGCSDSVAAIDLVVVADPGSDDIAWCAPAR